MSEQFQTDRFDVSQPRISYFAPLPPWLASRLLGPGEEVTWVRGPRFNPSWERYVTHPLLFLVALLVSAACLAVDRLLARSVNEMSGVSILVAFILVFGSICVLAFFNGYFTRLVVTNLRLLIIQGYEVRRRWSIDALPRSLLKYSRREDGQWRPTIDLDSLQKTLGGSSDQFADSKTIRAFGKQIDQIKASENGQTDRDQTWQDR
jgi:hypothetical protein